MKLVALLTISLVAIASSKLECIEHKTPDVPKDWLDMAKPYVKKLVTEKASWSNGTEALNDALKLGASVTNKLRNIIEVCQDDSAFNFNHLVDQLSSDILTEQYKRQRDITDKASTLDKMMDKHGILGEFLFDK
ncbi:hypothetical protein GWI33_005893 [Rhynchophorus ferrugineus]|uniref:Uncharacterized protein n=1 Tax=Rhynchophorus ferrugineus TaxID=354439 RepID=A0A834IWN5_RHYFE|nr:hypothetical protein GWI33_005893 [Rhynchophorus ferrugineus]